jgi:hypothetical protein
MSGSTNTVQPTTDKISAATYRPRSHSSQLYRDEWVHQIRTTQPENEGLIDSASQRTASTPSSPNQPIHYHGPEEVALMPANHRVQAIVAIIPARDM